MFTVLKPIVILLAPKAGGESGVSVSTAHRLTNDEASGLGWGPLLLVLQPIRLSPTGSWGLRPLSFPMGKCDGDYENLRIAIYFFLC